jgi:hypothetical protein
MIDKTLLNISSIIIGTAGLYSVLTKFSVPQLNSAFWGINPYAVKRDIIDGVMTTIFTLFTLTGLFVQAILFIFESSFKDRIYNTSFYLLYFVIGIVIVTLIVFLLAKIGKIIAEKRWRPIIIENQREIFERSFSIVENNGLNEEQFGWPDRERYSQQNLEGIDGNITQIEELLELPNKLIDRKERIKQLEGYFKK